MSKPKPEPAAEIELRVTPRASRPRVTLEDEVVRVWVSAPPVDGEANAAVVRVLADLLNVAPSKMTIVRGGHGRSKVVRIEGQSRQEILALIGDRTRGST